MELKQIKELMAAMERCGTTRLHLKKGSFELELERKNGAPGSCSSEMEFEDRPRIGVARTATALPASTDHKIVQPVQEEKKELPGTFITSPMVGTFYASPSPDDPSFVKAGDRVEKGNVVCIIEAMKVMNEIKAQSSGTILEILVDNGHPVEFGTKLFRIQS